MQIQQIIYFHKIVEEKSMNRAAEGLYITQSNLSYAIKKLEEEIGAQLLVRSNKGVSLTVEGKKFLEYSTVIMEQLDLIERMSLKKSNSNLTISSYPMMANSYFLRKYYDLLKKEQQEEFRITLQEERMDAVIRSVSQSESEIGFIQFNQRQEKEVLKLLKKENLVFEKLGESTWYAAVGEKNPYFKKKSIDIKSMMQFPIIRAKDDYFSNITKFLEVDGVSLKEFRKIIFCNDSESKIKMLLESDVTTFIPGWSRRDYEQLGVHILEIEHCDISITLGWIKKKRENLSENAQKYLDVVMNYFDN